MLVVKNVVAAIAVLFFAFIPFYKVTTVEFVDGHDFLLHFQTLYALEENLQKGVLLPRWLSNATYGYGSPVFTFKWMTPYFLGAYLHQIGLSYQAVFKILLILPNLISAFGFYLFIKRYYGLLPGIVAATVFIWTPYRFLDVFIRNALGEVFFLAFLPFVFYFLAKPDNYIKICLGGLSFFLMIYSHQLLTLIIFPTIIAFILFDYLLKKDSTKLFKQLVLIINGLLLSFFYWFPAVSFQSLVPNEEFGKKALEFPPFLSLLRSKWEGGSVVGGQRLIMSCHFKLVF